ncbi:DUF4253 domain-containing protein [Kitasatospora sp. NPDC096147]|uniref:DUF4253 domain-containing protein n=1 Tax=Kitasatospora sp. NPDC096147 TaxID=3364093 RepID=UPI00382D9743
MRAELARSVAALLPPGGWVEHEDGTEPVLWLSAGPVGAGLWESVLAEHPRSELWPLLLDGESREGQHMWERGEFHPGRASRPDLYDPGLLLARWWTERLAEDGPEPIAPFGVRWPGLVPGGPPAADPARAAAGCARDVVSRRSHVRLGLVAAESGAEALALLGWDGVAEQDDDLGTYAAVLASWEDRFGARLVAVDGSELVLSVAAPPSDEAQALRIAAEHYAFCPDGIRYGPTDTLAGYAPTLIDSGTWRFCWD